MEEWNSLPNYSSAYHTYAYGMTYPPPPVQNHPSLGWSGTGFTPSGSDGLFLDVPPTAPQNALPQDATRVPGVPLAGSPSDSSSETEPSTPDSWSSPSADESYALRPPPAPCSPAETACAEPVPAPCSWAKGAEEQGQQQGALLDMDPGAAPAAGKRARKLRTAFSETQMTALCERYMIKMYLTPAEMKSLADKIGLSYKQVKTWFQNRRMKQKRQQKTLTEGEEQVPSSGYPIIQPLLLESSSSAYPNIPPLALFRGFYSTSQFGNQGYFKKNPPPFYPSQPCYPSRVNVGAGSLESWALPSAGRFKYGSLNGPIRYSGKVIGYECSTAPLQPQASATLPQWGGEELQIPASFRK
ncbi:homeobox protein NANOG isoform X2 [Lepisosteus oculatus]|uniref:homeobox protein NANOG isoform X2 n=1 Tax=Lepisosteus oculatus TaxID=7918 RepID=UPI00371F61FB